MRVFGLQRQWDGNMRVLSQSIKGQSCKNCSSCSFDLFLRGRVFANILIYYKCATRGETFVGWGVSSKCLKNQSPVLMITSSTDKVNTQPSRSLKNLLPSPAREIKLELEHKSCDRFRVWMKLLSCKWTEMTECVVKRQMTQTVCFHTNNKNSVCDHSGLGAPAPPTLLLAHPTFLCLSWNVWKSVSWLSLLFAHQWLSRWPACSSVAVPL